MNDAGELSRKKIFKDDDEAVGLLSKNKEPSLPGTLNRQKSDLLLDDLEKAREILQAAISLEPINKVSFSIFNINSLWFKSQIKTFSKRRLLP